jgi:diaminopimelate decarboxylase
VAAFAYKGKDFHCEGVNLFRVAEEVGTPIYVYSRDLLEKRYRAVAEGLGSEHFSIVATLAHNGSLALAHALQQDGAWADISGPGELELARKAGFPPDRQIMTAYGKTEEHLEACLEFEGSLFLAHNSEDLETINSAARLAHKSASALLRVHNKIDPKKGKVRPLLDVEEVAGILKLAPTMGNIDVVGLYLEVDLGLKNLGQFMQTVKSTLDFIRTYQVEGLNLGILAVAGGLGLPRPDNSPSKPEEFTGSLQTMFEEAGIQGLFFPGRWLWAGVGVLLVRVVYMTRRRGRAHLVADAGFSHFPRPALFHSPHNVARLRRGNEGTEFVGDLVGPLGTPPDFLAREINPGPLEAGDFLAVSGVAADGFVLSSQANGFMRPAEVLVDGSQWHLVRPAERATDFLFRQRLPATDEDE